jgi:hypothetical protein
MTLSEYVRTLKYRQHGGAPLAVTQEERDMVAALFENHATAIRALYEILAETDEAFEPLAAGEAVPGEIHVKINATDIKVSSIPKLYTQVLQFLVDNNHLQGLQLPFQTGTKRYLLVECPDDKEPEHPSGNTFIRPIKYKNFCMEANVSRATGIDYLRRLVKACHLTFQTLE